MSRQTLILIVDDDAELAHMASELLAREGWGSHVVLTGADGEKAIGRLQPDLVLLDVMLPDINGYDLCRRWRAANANLPLMMLTARGESLDRVLGLEIGADDYLAKPFEPRELVARVRALLRRSRLAEGAASLQTPVLRFPGLSIDPQKREVLADGKALSLTSTEFKLLLALASAPGLARSREALSDEVQAGNYRPLDRTVDVQIARLRRKLREACPGTEWIDTQRGEGYVFVARAL